MALGLLGGCGGDFVETTIQGPAAPPVAGGGVIALDRPDGPNTVEVVIDRGPAQAGGLGIANLPYVTVTVCAPGSTSACATLDHVLVDTGSIGLRVLASRVAALALPPVTVAGAEAAACFPFVLGAVWGPVARADVQLGARRAAAVPIQLIDDAAAPRYPVPADCLAAADGELMNSVARLQANGVLGIGMLPYDCGQPCVDGASGLGHALYHACGAGGCVPAPMPAPDQVAHPVAHFASDNNGTVLVLPSLPASGAEQVRGRLVFGIGTQANNVPAAEVLRHPVGTDPLRDDYLYLGTLVEGRAYPASTIDSGANALYFDDPALPIGCDGAAPAPQGWYCPAGASTRRATVVDAAGGNRTVQFTVLPSGQLFATPNVAFATLAGTAGQGAASFVWGLPFFFGRSVYTSIWGQALSEDGPWYAF